MKKYFFAGFILLLPSALTLFIIFFLFDFFTTPFVPIVTELLKALQKFLPFALHPDLNTLIARILALILLCVFVLLLGIVARWFLIRNLLQWANKLLSRIPLVKTIFHVSRDLFTALFAQGDKKIFKRPIMVPFPSKPTYSIGFIAGEVAEECQKHSPEPLISIFSPTAPHPTSGFLLLAPKKDTYEIGMTNEDAVKFILSCGVIVPEENATP
jgi:uncharacterized membrane protein